MRLFIAINFPLKIKEKILRQVEKLKVQFPRVSWVRLTNLHLTLKFLGYPKEEKLPKVKRGIEKAVKNLKPFTLIISKLGYFYREPLIIWLRVEQSEVLNDLVSRLEKEMGKLGFRKEKRAYSPHVTLGRGRKLERGEVIGMKKEISESAAFSPIRFTVSKIALMESQLKPTGAVYTLTHEFPLTN